MERTRSASSHASKASCRRGDAAHGNVLFSADAEQSFRVELVDFFHRFLVLNNGRIDVGVMDPAFAPAVNVPAEGGVSPEDLYGLVRCLASTGMLCCVDLLEYNPLRDEDGLTAASIESVMYGLWG